MIDWLIFFFFCVRHILSWVLGVFGPDLLKKMQFLAIAPAVWRHSFDGGLSGVLFVVPCCFKTSYQSSEWQSFSIEKSAANCHPTNIYHLKSHTQRCVEFKLSYFTCPGHIFIVLSCVGCIFSFLYLYICFHIKQPKPPDTIPSMYRTVGNDNCGFCASSFTLKLL